MSLKDKEKWNRKYGDSKHVSERTPCEWMTDNVDLLTGTGHALDIAAGTGRNAVYAASLGYDVVGIDISEEGIKKIRALAKEKNVNVSTIVADLDNYKLEENSFELILCFYFLNRSLFKEIARAVKPGGLVIFETFTIDHLKYCDFKKNWVLSPNELLKVFSDFRILRYQEVDRNEKGFASLIARR